MTDGVVAGERTRVALLYGGRSPEHEVSCRSALGVLRQLDLARYDVTPIGIDATGRWWLQSLQAVRLGEDGRLPIATDGPELCVHPHPHATPITTVEGGAALPVDVVLPIVHGPLCEDGALQGLLELTGLPYVGSGVLGSALCMDKDVAKRLVLAAGMETADYVCIRRHHWPEWRQRLDGLPARLGLPLFVKPANLGSSVGISRAGDLGALVGAIELSLQYDDKVLVERCIDARELELSVLSPEPPATVPEVSRVGEIAAEDAFYDYARKYEDADGARIHVPADLPEDVEMEAMAMAGRIFELLECEGLARVDLFLDRRSGKLLFNEANTLPGFTSISQYPMLWEASGLPYPALLDRLIAHALRHHAKRARLLRTRKPDR